MPLPPHVVQVAVVPEVVSTMLPQPKLPLLSVGVVQLIVSPPEGNTTIWLPRAWFWTVMGALLGGNGVVVPFSTKVLCGKLEAAEPWLDI